MKNSVSSALFLLSFSASLIGAEPSAFGAGDLNSPNPYGLTSSEEVILETKKNLQSVVIKSNNQANQVDSLRERIDGLQSVIEGLSIKTYEARKELQALSDANKQQQQSNNEMALRLSEMVQTNTQTIEQLKAAIAELSKVIDTINLSYVTKEEFNNLVNDINAFKDVVAKELQSTKKVSTATQGDSFKGLSTADVYNKAKALYDQKNYTDAIKHYTYLIEKNYKPAYAHYMIGDIYFKRKNYADAIAYYKKSSALYSNASYMPQLMLHTAISMDKTGDKKNAKLFYNGVVQKFPDTSEAKEAKKQLGLMN